MVKHSPKLIGSRGAYLLGDEKKSCYSMVYPWPCGCKSKALLGLSSFFSIVPGIWATAARLVSRVVSPGSIHVVVPSMRVGGDRVWSSVSVRLMILFCIFHAQPYIMRKRRSCFTFSPCVVMKESTAAAWGGSHSVRMLWEGECRWFHGWEVESDESFFLCAAAFCSGFPLFPLLMQCFIVNS